MTRIRGIDHSPAYSEALQACRTPNIASSDARSDQRPAPNAVGSDVYSDVSGTKHGGVNYTERGVLNIPLIDNRHHRWQRYHAEGGVDLCPAYERLMGVNARGMSTFGLVP